MTKKLAVTVAIDVDAPAVTLKPAGVLTAQLPSSPGPGPVEGGLSSSPSHSCRSRRRNHSRRLLGGNDFRSRPKANAQRGCIARTGTSKPATTHPPAVGHMLMPGAPARYTIPTWP
jgi:hypothetical protein